jgi:hypothetical protein
MRLPLLIAAAALLMPQHAGASLLTFTATGTFGAAVPDSFFTPTPPVVREWTLQFSLDNLPPVTPDVDTFSVTPINFHYTVGGVDLGLTPSNIYFYDAANFGMFLVEFDLQDFLAFSGPVMFTGTLANPILHPGVFVDDGSGGSSADGIFVSDTNWQSLAGTVVTVSPEPSAIQLTALAVMAILWFGRVRSRKRSC